MANRHCPTCNKQVVSATTRAGAEIELVRYEGPQLYGLKSEPVEVLGVRRHMNRAFTATGYVEHACTSELDTLGAAAKVVEFPPSLGDPIPAEKRIDLGDE